MGPAWIDARMLGGISASIDFRRALESRVNEVSCANVGD